MSATRAANTTVRIARRVAREPIRTGGASGATLDSSLGLDAMKRVMVAMLFVPVVTACQPSAEPPRPSPTDAYQPPVRGGRVVEGAFADAKTFAPFLANDPSSLIVSGIVYDSLFKVDAKTGEIQPNLGRWTVSPDGLTYRWRIEPGAVWSDGRPIVGEDYLTGVKAVARSKKTVRAASFQDIDGFDEYRNGTAATIKGITIAPLDARSFAVKFKRVFCPALTNAFGPAAGPLPTHV